MVFWGEGAFIRGVHLHVVVFHTLHRIRDIKWIGGVYKRGSIRSFTVSILYMYMYQMLQSDWLSYLNVHYWPLLFSG